MTAAWLRLLRAPAALTALGDTVAGAAAGGRPLRGRRLLLPLASASFYWSGMVFNDWADRRVDAVERPERPIPSGEIRPAAALAAAGGLAGAGMVFAAIGGGRAAVPVAAALTGAIACYDGYAKRTAAGPATMALCRGLDVLLGAPGAPAARAATVLAVHTVGVTVLSRGEVHGAGPGACALALTATAICAASGGSAGMPWRIGYAATVGHAQLRAARDRGANAVRRATAAGIHGMIPLQATLVAAGGAQRRAAMVAAAYPVARLLARKASPT
ncbi:SCO3242 family prenyltransferase [Sciscionella sediminilitoris]|uniref:SCO3242 family prenyltransferase n=1 Tax=Sciscionella sediminilitoris TaxID=1445613 RepID=UPI0004DF78B1|nr:UbiA family prenyltransferase [Sciscionella sp. SE31]